MRRANTQLQTDRRAEILDAAHRSFARMGFHQTTMQQICLEAGMSPGNLYRYFPSKEAIIAGITERDRAAISAQLANAPFGTDFYGTLENLARQHLVDTTDDEVGLCFEMVSEARHNPAIATLMQGFDKEIRSRFTNILREAALRGDVARDIDFESVTTVMMMLGDGVWLRRAADPAFDAEKIIPIFMNILRCLLGRSQQGQPQDIGNRGI